MRVNYFVRLIALLVHGLKSLIGVALLVLCLYLILAKWGSLEPSFFNGVGIMIGLTGLVIIFSSHVGGQSIHSQMRSYGYWSGRRMMYTYIAIELIMFAFVILLYVYASSILAQFDSDSAKIDSGGDSSAAAVPFSSFEHLVEDKFNTFFFAMASGCQDVYVWFWDIVNEVCPRNLDQRSCQACHDYSVTVCAAYENGCYSTTSTVDNSYCPYMLCRAGVLRYVSSNTVSRAFVGVILAFGVLQIVSVLLGAKLATFDFKNRGVIRIVPIETLQERVIQTAPPRPIFAHATTHRQQQQHHYDLDNDEPLL